MGYLSYYYLTILRPSVACSNIMGGGVSSPSSVHRAVRICHYIMIRKTINLFPLHLRLICPPTLINKPYDLLLPPAHAPRGSWPHLLFHHNFKNRMCSNVMGHTIVMAGDVPPNFPHTHVHQHITNVYLPPLSVLEPWNLDRNLSH